MVTADGLIDRALHDDASEGLRSADRSPFLLTRDLKAPVRVCVSKLDGLHNCGAESLDAAEELVVVCELWANCARLCLPESTRLPSSVSVAEDSVCVHWHSAGGADSLVFPVQYRDLPLDTLLTCTVWRPGAETPVGGTSVNVFSSVGLLRRDSRRLQLFPGVVGQGTEPCATLGYRGSLPGDTERLLRRRRLSRAAPVRWLDDMLPNLARQPPLHAELVVYVDGAGLFPHPAFHLSPVAEAAGAACDAEAHAADNPCEGMEARLVSAAHRIVDPTSRPNLEEQVEIQHVLSMSAMQRMTIEQGALLRRYRHWLCDNRKGFVGFMRTVSWWNPEDVKVATELMDRWDGLTLADCLELLGRHFAGVAAVRRRAVQRLRDLEISDLAPVLPQLVQGLRYEDAQHTDHPHLREQSLRCMRPDGDLLQLLLDVANEDFAFCSNLYWAFEVASQSSTIGDGETLFKRHVEELRRQIKPESLAQLELQERLVRCLRSLRKSIDSGGDREAKKRRLEQLLEQGSCGVKECFAQSDGEGKKKPPRVTSPLEPHLELSGILSTGVHLFNSAKVPMLLSTKRLGGGVRGLMYKSGDDIRQDQLVLQLITVIDALLRRDGLDLRLVPYRALALSVTDGLVEPVPNSYSLEYVRSDIRGFLRRFECNWAAEGEGEFPGPVWKQHAEDPDVIRSLNTTCMDNWVRSNAGYAVITFILGVGDRHLENLMVTSDGRFFHIDFGFILGRDPKFFAPPLKLTMEQVLAMGGTEHPRWEEFKALTCTAYNIVRKHSRLIINLLQMMVDANIPDLTGDRSEDAIRGANMRIQAVEKKLCRERTEAEATRYIQEVIEHAKDNPIGRIHDGLHRVAASLRT